MHVQVLKRYRDRDTKAIHEAGELVEYDNIPRIVVLTRGGYVEPLEPLPADAETEPATNVVTTTVNTDDLKITMDHIDKKPTKKELDAIKARYAGNVPTEVIVTGADLEANPELVNTGIKEGDSITLGPDGSLIPPVVTDGFSQVVNTTTTTADPVVGQLTTGTSDVPPADDPTGKKKGGKPGAKTATKKSNKEK